MTERVTSPEEGGEALRVGSRLAPDDPAVPPALREAMRTGATVLFFLRAFT
ncbi:MAG TPA: hypothetical protein VFZ11_13215 [Gemmatimonadaceae bacterium]